MTRLILQVFDSLKTHALLCWTSLVVLTALLGLLLSGQSYKEDISDFLPLDKEQQQVFQDYQNTSSARRIYAIFQTSDSTCQAAVDLYCEVLDRADTTQIVEYMTNDDPEVMQDAMNAIYARIPYLLTKEDYARIDSLMADPDFISHQLENDKQLLMLPTAGMMTLQIQHDPLNLFVPVIEQLKPKQKVNQTLLLIDSPFGASETEHNAKLVDMLEEACDSIKCEYPDVAIHLTGGPVIAVGNARQIKNDSMISISIAIILILILLWLAFRNIRNLLLITLSIGWGWLFAMGCLTLVNNDVSIIVIGISSVILGIAVNYPLHLIAHLPYAVDIRSALREIATPLVVGNITTVGAFLCLVPLDSVALRDLGLFSAFLLIGTILFVLLWLPHMVDRSSTSAHDFLGRIGDVQLENKKWIVWTVVVLTIVLGYFSLQTTFDADLRNINYMTVEQKNDLKYLGQFANNQSQVSDLSEWNEWRQSKGSIICQRLKDIGRQEGFADDSFDEFYKLISSVPSDDGLSITSTIVNSLSDNFNYIGWACGVIVFFFLWFSLGSIELALLSFLPMAISWVWILGIMALFGLKFNVVNIIIATFIFGQGDDYTIFMTEGCQYEYAYRRKMLSSYKHSIIISALIMFIGIGALIVAKHPALHSLAEVTIIGMFSVVLMAYLFPPLIFRWLVFSKGKERLCPLTLRSLFRKGDRLSGIDFVSDCYRYKGAEISSAVNKHLRKYCKDDVSQKINGIISSGVKTVLFINNGWGEISFLLALQNPEINFIGIDYDGDKSNVARFVAENRTPNLTIMDSDNEIVQLKKIERDNHTRVILFEPTTSDVNSYSYLNPLIIQ